MQDIRLKQIDILGNSNIILNIKRKTMRHKIFMWKTLTNYGDKKQWGLRHINWNSLFKIKSHRFTWSFYPKDLLSSTNNLIHVHKAAITYCFLVDPLVPPKVLWSSTNNSNNQILEWENENGVIIRILSLKITFKEWEVFNN